MNSKMKYQVILLLFLIVGQSWSLKCNSEFKCDGTSAICDPLRQLLQININGNIQTCQADQNRCAVILKFIYNQQIID